MCFPRKEVYKMDNRKTITACLYIKNGKAVKGIKDMTVIDDDPVALALSYSNYGADEILIFDFSNTDEEHTISLEKIKEISRLVDIPLTGAGNIRRFEDVKKLLYAGCTKAALNLSKETNVQLAEEVATRFGSEKIVACVLNENEIKSYDVLIKNFTSELYLLDETKIAASMQVMYDCGLIHTVHPILLKCVMDEKELHGLAAVLRQHEDLNGVCGGIINKRPEDIMKLKWQCRGLGIDVVLDEPALKWEELKLNSDGMVPVVVQDYKTSEVLMVAYMNEEAFDKTLETGVMTYFSRSRNELWVKGATSGHYQYLKAMYADCDNDTLLAKVRQVGAACHTGNKSCFFNEVIKKEFNDTNPIHVFEKEYNVIMDRKINPKEGSYTNYLFDKGIDKILKKVGEECTEIIIAAKNPDAEELKYEIADFLYHCMVLMAHKDVTWDDIIKEMSQR